MKEFYLNNIDKTNLFLAFFFALCFLGFGSFMLPSILEYFSAGTKFPYEETLLFLVCYIWAFYVFTVIISISLNKYKAVCIDEENEKLIFKSKSSTFDLPFEYISEIKVRYGRIVPRISLACIKVRDRNNNYYTCPISYFGQFYDAIPEYIIKEYDFSWFITTW